ncbi:MAG: thioredoxin-dependent thiol peroxidase [bacterium]
MPAEGTVAPDFKALLDDESTLQLKSLRGSVVVLFFYPKDDTSGCTMEACGFQDALPRLQGVDAKVIGVSPDPVKKHIKFKEKYGLTYPLIADTDHAVCEAYGVWAEKSMYGRKYMGVLRTTFVIDQKGRIAKVFEKVKPEGHAAEVTEAVKALG